MLTIVGICAVFCLLTLQVQNTTSVTTNTTSVTTNTTSVTTTTTPQPTTLASTTARLEVGHNCSSPSYSCAAPLMCDHDDLCRIRIDNDCSGTDATCANGLKCDQNRTCKGNIGYNCSSDDMCATDLRCNGTHCNEVVPVNYPCASLNGHSCPRNTNCTSGTCQCNTTEYYLDSRTGKTACEKRIKPGNPCSLDFPVDTCVTGAKCDGDLCHCVTEQLYVVNKENNGCYKLLTAGQTGCDNESNHCVPEAECNSTTTTHICECHSTHFTSYDSLCEPRKPGDGSICNKTEQCVDNANCIKNECWCKQDYYNSERRCEQRLPWDDVCDANIKDQCLFFGGCIDGRCKCSHGNFKILNGSCSPPLSFNDSCELFNHDPQQCGTGTHCVFRSHDTSPRCACDLNHYFDGQSCLPRIRVGHPCTYVGDYKYENQCVQNAYCYNSSHICVCEEHFYARQGLCPQKVRLGDICDPWDNSENQCESGTCTHGRCL